MRDLLNETERERLTLRRRAACRAGRRWGWRGRAEREARWWSACCWAARWPGCAATPSTCIATQVLTVTSHRLQSTANQTLARPAAPLAERISSVGRTNKNWWSWQRPLTDWKTNFRLSVPVKRTTTRDEQQTRVTLGRRVCNVGSGNVGLKTYYSRDAGGDQLNFFFKKQSILIIQ